MINKVETDINTMFGDGEEVSLYEMLDARENRVRRQERILELYKGCLISFSLNIPGRIKSCGLFNEAFDKGLDFLRETLDNNDISIEFMEPIYKKTGPECILSVLVNPENIKRLTAGIEDEHPLGRLFDFDVITRSRKKVSREDIGLPSRQCLICSKPAFICARSRYHGETELLKKVQEILGRALSD